jgi:hypothetical protein
LFVDDDAFACYGYTELLRIDGWAASSCDFGCAAASALVVSDSGYGRAQSRMHLR